MKKREKLTTSLISILLTIASSLIACILYLYTNNWFGKNDLWSFLFWTVFFSSFIVLVGLMLLRESSNWRRAMVFFTYPLFGLLAGFVMTIAVRLILGPWFGAFSFPVLYLWLFSGCVGILPFLLAWTKLQAAGQTMSLQSGSFKRRLGKILIYVVGIPVGFILSMVAIVFLLHFGSVYIWNKGENETVIIPENFTGPLILVYDSPLGVQEKFEQGRRLYEFPQDGVLRTQFSPNTGWSDLAQFYYVGSNGRRILLFNATVNWNKAPDSVIAVFGGELGVFRLGSGSTNDPGTVWNTTYEIATQKQLDSMNFKWGKRIDSVLTKVAKEISR